LCWRGPACAVPRGLLFGLFAIIYPVWQSALGVDCTGRSSGRRDCTRPKPPGRSQRADNALRPGRQAWETTTTVPDSKGTTCVLACKRVAGTLATPPHVHRKGWIDMSFEGMAGMRAAIDDVATLLGSLGDGEWNAPSAAAGWTVKDVATHLPDLLNILVTAVQGDLSTDLGIEPLNDARVAAKSSWSPAQVLDDLARQSAVALPMFEGLQAEPGASTEVQLLDLGAYPANFIPDMFAFDFYTHLRWDILAPRGPLHHDVPAPDEARLKPAVGWLLAGIPQMQAGIRESLAKPVTLALSGPGGGTWTLEPGDKLIKVTAADPDVPAAAVIQSTSHEFTAWATTRLPWRDHTTVTGDQQTAATFLDTLNLT
jgi:uncharacterized protein (TIGR03083 family)